MDAVKDILCPDCELARTKESERERWMGIVSGLRQVRRITNIPDELTLLHHRARSENPHRRTGGYYQIDSCFVMLPGPMDSRCMAPNFRFIPDDPEEEPITFLFLAQRVQLDGIKPHVEMVWDSQELQKEGRLLIAGGWQSSLNTDLMRLMEAVQPALPAGRPRGSTQYTMDEVIEKIRRAHAAFKSVQETDPNAKFTKDFFCEQSQVSVNTLNTYLKRWDAKWSELKKQALSEN
jgi:hypothetical protein